MKKSPSGQSIISIQIHPCVSLIFSISPLLVVRNSKFLRFDVIFVSLTSYLNQFARLTIFYLQLFDLKVKKKVSNWYSRKFKFLWPFFISKKIVWIKFTEKIDWKIVFSRDEFQWQDVFRVLLCRPWKRSREMVVKIIVICRKWISFTLHKWPLCMANLRNWAWR